MFPLVTQEQYLYEVRRLRASLGEGRHTCNTLSGSVSCHSPEYWGRVAGTSIVGEGYLEALEALRWDLEREES